MCLKMVIYNRSDSIFLFLFFIFFNIKFYIKVKLKFHLSLIYLINDF